MVNIVVVAVASRICRFLLKWFFLILFNKPRVQTVEGDLEVFVVDIEDDFGVGGGDFDDVDALEC